MDVPPGRFWFPIRCYARQKIGGPITTEVYRVQILAAGGGVRDLVVPEIAVDTQGAASWPIHDARSGLSYNAIPPFMMRPTEGWDFFVFTAINGDTWTGHFTYLEVISSDPDEAWRLFWEYTRGTRELTRAVR